MVVNGSGESDWPAVAALAGRHPDLLPAFGCHPWFLRERTADWKGSLAHWLDRLPASSVGEIGLDRWMLENPERWRAHLGREAGDPPSMDEQEEAFVIQWRMAAERNRPASLHCLKAFGPLLALLEATPRPARGFLLHSYGGPAEMVPAFARLGAYFSVPGYFMHPRKARQREVFRIVPADRLLIETDAPDQLPPASGIRHALTDPRTGLPLNHPANLPATGESMAQFLGVSAAELAVRTSANFERLFGPYSAP